MDLNPKKVEHRKVASVTEASKIAHALKPALSELGDSTLEISS